jgi:hypothetical protein
VEDPAGVRYRVRLGRSGVARFDPIGGIPGLLRWATGLSTYVLRREAGWSVEVVPVNPWRVFYDPVLNEDCPDRASADRRAVEVVDAISEGKLGWDGPWSLHR